MWMDLDPKILFGRLNIYSFLICFNTFPPASFGYILSCRDLNVNWQSNFRTMISQSTESSSKWTILECWKYHRCLNDFDVEIILAKNHRTFLFDFKQLTTDPSGIYRAFHWHSWFSWYKTMVGRLTFYTRFNISTQDKQDWHGIYFIPWLSVSNFWNGWGILQWNQPKMIKN